MQRKVFSIRTVAVAAAASAALSTFAWGQTATPPKEPFRLTSPKLQEGGFLDRHYAGPADCGGDNVSLPLQWSNAPANTKSFAIILFDFDGRSGFGVTHWIAYGIPPNVTSLTEGEGSSPSPNLTGGSNTRKVGTYYGPCAPAEDTPHHYIYSVYALDVPKDELPAGLTRDEFLAKVKGRLLGLVSLVSNYRRPK
jgi:Raf kinase inhibitor-like YbhB/YbcL family protein